MGFLAIYITHPDKATAERISGALVREKLAACANCFPIQSAYWWEGAVQNEAEWVSLVKTIPAHWEELVAYVEQHHPYDLPCIMRAEVSANAAYEQWIAEQVR